MYEGSAGVGSNVLFIKENLSFSLRWRHTSRAVMPKNIAFEVGRTEQPVTRYPGKEGGWGGSAARHQTLLKLITTNGGRRLIEPCSLSQ